MSDYTIAVGPCSGSGPTQELAFYQSWTLDKNFDDGCTFSFTVPGYAPEVAAISELDTDVWVYRSGVLNQRFRIVAVNQSWGPSGEDVVSVQAVCYRRLLATRYLQTPLTFIQVSQGDIIWQLIQHTQATTNGNLGITLGSAGPSVLRDRSYEQGQNILDIIVDLTNVIGGPTWDIDQNLQLIVSRADLYPFNSAPVVLGATARALSRPSSASKFGNVALVSGNQTSTTDVIVQSSTLATDPRGRWERRASYPSVVLQSTLVDHAQGLVTSLQSPTSVWQIDVVPERYYGDAQYKMGDYVEIVQPASTAAPIGTPAIKMYGQVLAVQVQQDADGDEQIDMRVIEIGPSGIIVENAASDVTAGGYRTVTWNSSGSLTLRGTSLNVEYLIVGGGGGGGGTSNGQPTGGGGGAGGLLTNVGSGLLSLISGSYPVVVGLGGNGGPASINSNGTSGGASSFASLTAVGGGLGRNPSTNASDRIGLSGGSGGGGAGSTIAGGAGGSGTVGQGNGGGSGSTGSPGLGGGGGGRGSAGGSPTTAGTGQANTITGSSVTYAAGGAGGVLVGGAGSNGTANRGNGGQGAGGTGGAGGNGGDGVVIVRWTV